MAKRISVIIPSLDRGVKLDESLLKIKEQLDKDLDEILIVDGSRGPAKARNEGIAKSLGKYLLFVNDDTIINNEYIKTHLTFHKRHPDINMAVCGPFVTDPRIANTPIMKWLDLKSGLHFIYKKNSGRMPWYYFWTGNISVKKDFIVKNKLFFDESFSTAAWEDVEFGYRAEKCGLKIYCDKNLLAYHYHGLDLNGVLVRFFSHGRGLFRIATKLPHRHLPMLAKKFYRLMARIGLLVSFYPYNKHFLIKIFDLENNPINLVMQYLVVGEKITGFDFESKQK